MLATAAAAQSSDGGANGGATPGSEDATVASLFADFLHYARLGRFEQARVFAGELLDHPELDPVALVAIADRDRRSVNTLITVIDGSSLGDEARRVLDVLHEGESLMRQDPRRIAQNIEKLAGSPRTEYLAVQHLVDSGEYAVPWMVQALTDRSQQPLWPRILRAVPQIGHAAVNPLVVALASEDHSLRQSIVRMLAEVGYAHAVPYLRKLLANPDLHVDTRRAIEDALGTIARRSGHASPRSPAVGFLELAEQYYAERGSLAADTREATANVWYFKDGFIDAVIVPREIYGPVMAMRCAEETLGLDSGNTEAVSLWLAANIRREARLGLDIESGETVEDDGDPTRPPGFPRALYFSRISGAGRCVDVLARALNDEDVPVALGAIAALRSIAGEAALTDVEGEGHPLVNALLFPDPVVRVKAALALAEARPKSAFAGSAWVATVLAEALGQTGQDRYLVISPDQANLNRVVEHLRQTGAEVIADTQFYPGADRVRREHRPLTGVFISTSIEQPSVRRGLAELRREFLFRITPVVLLRDAGHYETARELAHRDARVRHLAADATGDQLTESMTELRIASGHHLPDPDRALELAMASADALRGLSSDHRTVLSPAAAEPALRLVLKEAESEQLRQKAAAVLAESNSEASQRTLAEVALSEAEAESLRVAVFASLADSAKINGSLLDADLLKRLVDTSTAEPNLRLRTAASRALGALNLADHNAGEIIRAYYRG